MAIANGRRLNPLQAVAEGARCTWFLAAVEPRTARKRWIAGSLKPVGRLRVDAGALKALKEGKSLLPAGVTAVEGSFERGDAVVVCDPAGPEVASGLGAYSAAAARLIMGQQDRAIRALTGTRGRQGLIPRHHLLQ